MFGRNGTVNERGRTNNSTGRCFLGRAENPKLKDPRPSCHSLRVEGKSDTRGITDMRGQKYADGNSAHRFAVSTGYKENRE